MDKQIGRWVEISLADTTDEKQSICTHNQKDTCKFTNLHTENSAGISLIFLQ